MKTKLKSALFISLFLFFAINFSSFSQDNLINDDFEADALGTLPNGWVIRYEGTGYDDQKIVDSPVKNGNHSFQVSGSGWAANLSKSVTGMPNEVTLEGWMQAENVASGGRSGLAIGNPSVNTWGAFIARIEFYNGNLITYHHTGNSGGYGTQYVLQPATPNIWYHVKIETNTVAQTYKVFIDGVQASSNTTGTTITEFPLLTIASQTSVELYGNSMIYFDDIKLYETSNLIAHYPFNGNANDESGNGNNGIIENETSLTTDRFGNPDSAYSFDGIDDYIRVPHSSSLDITGNEISISMWLYNDNPDAGNTWKGISKGGYDVANGYELIFTNYPTANGKTSLNVGGGGFFTSSFNTYSDQWIMLTGTFNNGVGKMYINGVEQPYTTQGSIGLSSSTSDLYIGTRNSPNSYVGFAKGKIDDIRIYNSALTDTEVLNLYNFNSLSVSDYEMPNINSYYIYNNDLYFDNYQNLQEVKDIRVYNLLAQNVFETMIVNQKTPLRFLEKGIYVITVRYKNGQIATKKFIIH